MVWHFSHQYVMDMIHGKYRVSMPRVSRSKFEEAFGDESAFGGEMDFGGEMEFGGEMDFGGEEQ